MDIIPLEGLQLCEKLSRVFINKTTVKPLALENESCLIHVKHLKRSYGKTSINMLVMVSAQALSYLRETVTDLQ